MTKGRWRWKTRRRKTDDSSGREATPKSIKNHKPRDLRDFHDIRVIPAYTTEEVFKRVGSDDIDTL